MHAARATFDTRTTITKFIILEYSSSANYNVRVIITFVIYVKHAARLSNSRYSVSPTASTDIFFFSSVRERHACPPISSSLAEEIASRIRVRATKNQTVLGGDGIALTFTSGTRSIRTRRRMFRVRDENRSPIIIYDAMAGGVCVSRTKKHVHLLKPGNP